jgi:hypothetical protein
MTLNFNLRSFTLEQLKKFDPNICILKAESFSDKQELILPKSPDIRVYCGNEILYLDIILYRKGTIKPYFISIYSENDKATVKQLATEFLSFL